jgi:hypothetical protein
MTIPPKKVVNANAGDADHVGGNDWDDISDFLNNVDKTGPVKINTRIYFRSGKREDRNPADTFSLIHVIPAIVANRNINWPLLTADGKPVIDTFLNVFTVDQQFNAGIIGGGYLQLTNDETITLTGTQNNLTVAATSTTVRLNPASTLTITGITGGIDGRILFLDNVSTVNVILNDDDAASTAGNRILLDVAQTLLPNQSCAIRYDSTSSRWRFWASASGTGGGAPATHATSHKSGGTDVIKLDEFAATTDITTLDSTTSAHGLLPKLGGGSTNFFRADGTWAPPPGAGGGEANTASNVGTGQGVFKAKVGIDLTFRSLTATSTKITLANNANDVGIDVPDSTTTTKGAVELATSGENAANVVVQGNDARLSDSRTPTAHATSHKTGGSDSIKLDELAAPTDVTTLNASTTAHGLLKKLSNVATEFMNGVGSWVALTSETTGTATGAANGSATAFNIAHGLGSTPFSAFVQVSSVLGSTINRSYTTDATNITVTFATAPTTGTITFHWRAVA